MPWDLTENFEYVVNPIPKAKVCFGSGLNRVCDEYHHSASGFMRRYRRDDNGIAPSEHTYDNYTLVKCQEKPRSNLGTWSKSPRFKPPKIGIQPEPHFNLFEPIKKNIIPFNSTTKRKGIFVTSDTPSPGDHDSLYKRREIKYQYSFNGPKSIQCAVQIKCVPYNLDVCMVCNCLCSKQGDYWHFENRVFMCRKHYARLFKNFASEFNGYKLMLFKPLRDCFFMHKHFSSPAAIKLMLNYEVAMKLRKEAYLDLYFPQRTEKHK